MPSLSFRPRSRKPRRAEGRSFSPERIPGWDVNARLGENSTFSFDSPFEAFDDTPTPRTDPTRDSAIVLISDRARGSTIKL